MYKSIAIVGLAAAVNAHPGAPPAYGSAPPAYSAPVESHPVSSAPVWSATPSSIAPYGSGSVVASSVPYPVSSAPIPSGSAYPSCWAACFKAAGISSESALCGNTEVDACIQSGCSSAEDQAYWAWYESYCPATSTPVTPPASIPVYSTSTVPAPIPSASYPACWSQCFAENHVTSEASLCGDDAVSQCIYETCDSAADQAYWAWYDGYCTGAATVTTVITLTSPCATGGSTTWASTAWTPAGPPTGPASPPASPPAGGWGAASTGGAWGSATSPAAATGTGAAAWPTQSGAWPVPATGGASMTAKSGFALLAGFLGLVALL